MDGDWRNRAVGNAAFTTMKRASRSALRNACAGLAWKDSVAQFIAVELWTCISYGGEPLYYAKSQIIDVYAKVPFQRFAPHNYSLRILSDQKVEVPD
jgi:hypothetical protein